MDHRALSKSSGDTKMNSELQDSVLAFGNLQVQGRAFAVDDHGSRVDHLLTRTIVAGKAAHGAEGKEELNRQRTGAVGNVDHAGEINAIESRISREVIQRRPHQMRDVLIESQRRQLVTRRSSGCIYLSSDRELQVRALAKSDEARWRVGQEMGFLVEALGHATDGVVVLALQLG